MYLWGVDGSETSIANFNSTLTPFDAIVDNNLGATSGDAYASITAALAAGKKTIAVRPGLYTDSPSISDSYVRIYGLGTGISSFATSSCVRIQGTVTVTNAAYGVQISNMIIEPQSSSYALSHSGQRDCVYDNIHCYEGGNNHFQFTLYDRLLVRNCTSRNAGDHAFRFADAVAQICTKTVLVGCMAYYSYGDGFSGGGATTGDAKGVTMLGCVAHNCGTGYGYGFRIGGRHRGSLVGCEALSNVSHGFYYDDPASAYVEFTTTGCRARNNGGYGFARPGTFSGAGHAIAGCSSILNSSGGYANWGGTPTTCV